MLLNKSGLDQDPLTFTKERIITSLDWKKKSIRFQRDTDGNMEAIYRNDFGE